MRISLIIKVTPLIATTLHVRLEQKKLFLFVIFKPLLARPASSHGTPAQISMLSSSTTDPQWVIPAVYTSFHCLSYKSMTGKRPRECDSIYYSPVYSPRLSRTLRFVLPAISRLPTSWVVPVSQHRSTNPAEQPLSTMFEVVAVVKLSFLFLFPWTTLRRDSIFPLVSCFPQLWHLIHLQMCGLRIRV